MKPFIQKLPLAENTSFVAKTFRTPHFEVGWHQHIEYELILFTEGAGMSFIGNHVGEFETGDIYFLGSGLPHTFQKRQADLVTGAVVVQFREDFWGSAFMELPESKAIRALFEAAGKGLKVSPASRELVGARVKELEHLQGFRRVVQLCESLLLLTNPDTCYPVSTREEKTFNHKEVDRIDRVFQYTIDHFKQPITLSTIAGMANMSIPAFCNYFKRSTKKTYIDFLHEVRIGYACRLLNETQQSVWDICIDSGFNTIANFNKQFLKVKKMPPLKYRKQFAARKGEGV